MDKNLEFKDKILLAPMAGVTDFAFRKLAEDGGADLTYTEMVSVKGLIYDSERTKDLLYFEKSEKPHAVQLFGSEPQDFKTVCKSPLLQGFDILDINMGCPAPKIVKNGDGSALMQDEAKAQDIIFACKENFNGLVTVKFRKGYDNAHQNYVSFAKMCERAGADAITIHGRTRTEMYSGEVDLNAIKKVKDAVSISVIGNGDVKDEKTFINMKECGVDAVMIGRGSLGQPWIFNKLKGNDLYVDVCKKAYEHVSLLTTRFPEKFVNVYMRKHLLWYLKGLTVPQSEKLKLVNGENLQKTMEIFDKILLK